VCGLVASILGPDREAEIEDVVQDVFILIYRKVNSFRNDCPLSGWVLTIARNRAIDYLRNSHRAPFYVGNEQLYDLLANDLTPDSEFVASAREQRDAVLRHVEQLPIRGRAAIYLYYWIGCTQAEIAELLDTNVPVVKSQLFRARRHLEKNLKAGGFLSLDCIRCTYSKYTQRLHRKRG
jgi:RNA polymerase sigma-70 factor (ECF subfamily)